MLTKVHSISQRVTATGSINQIDVTVMLMSLLACLTNLVLISSSPTFAAAVATVGQF